MLHLSLRSNAIVLPGVSSNSLLQCFPDSDPSGGAGLVARGRLPGDGHSETDTVRRPGLQRSQRKIPARDHQDESEAGGEAVSCCAGQTLPSAGITTKFM